MGGFVNFNFISVRFCIIISGGIVFIMVMIADDGELVSTEVNEMTATHEEGN